ncbi:MAG: zinc ribbon domain-containing protein [Candidatus Thermoplasmatota archaeon]
MIECPECNAIIRADVLHCPKCDFDIREWLREEIEKEFEERNEKMKHYPYICGA